MADDAKEPFERRYKKADPQILGQLLFQRFEFDTNRPVFYPHDAITRSIGAADGSRT